MNKIFCGIDWADHHHDDVALVDAEGNQTAKLRISDDRHRTPDPGRHRDAAGPAPQSLPATGRKVYAINPLAAASYRDRVSVARAKSDAADARVLANILRTDLRDHCPLPEDSELAQSVAGLARAHQDVILDRQQMVDQPRSGRITCTSYPRPRTRWDARPPR